MHEGHNPAAVLPDPFEPPPLQDAGGDYEQARARPFWAAVGGYAQLYALAALEPRRYQLQILHELDPCCFRSGGQRDGVAAYNRWVQTNVRAAGGGRFQTAVTVGNVHEVNPRDKVIIATLVEALRDRLCAPAVRLPAPRAGPVEA